LGINENQLWGLRLQCTIDITVSNRKVTNMGNIPLQRSFFQRLLGRCATAEPADRGCWSFSGHTVELNLTRIPELAPLGSGVRLESEALPERLLVVHGTDGQYYAFRNRCGHGGRRLDPMPDQAKVQCCSLGKTTCDYSGKVLAGAAKTELVTFVVTVEGDRLTVRLESSAQ
jgi:nitrite reductase/ring-hydroxylating ferredoxin subunit